MTIISILNKEKRKHLRNSQQVIFLNKNIANFLSCFEVKDIAPYGEEKERKTD